MTYVTGTLKGEVRKNGRIVAEITRLASNEGPSNDVRIGADQAALARINERKPGQFSTRVRVGVGSACFVEINKLRLAEAHHLERYFTKFGQFGARGLLGVYRDAWAPMTYLCADVCAKVVHSIPDDLASEAVKKITEIGAYADSGWIEFKWPEKGLSLIERQRAEWSNIEGSDFRPSGEAVVEMISGKDEINGLPAVLSAEPANSSAEIIFPVNLLLPNIPGGLLIRRTQWDPVMPKNLRAQLICSRSGKSPVMLRLNDEGIDPNGNVILLSGENLISINDKVRSVLYEII